MNFLRRIFGPKEPSSPRVNIEPWSATEDWRVGDLAECLVDGPWLTVANAEPSLSPPKKGEVSRVTALSRCTRGPTLVLAGRPNQAWQADGFRRLREDEHEGSAEDWVLLLESVKTKRLAEVRHVEIGNARRKND